MATYVQHVFANAHMYGIDPSTKSIEYAQKHHNNIKFAVLKNRTIDYPKHTFDLIYAAGVFHHIPRDEHKHYVDQIMRVLKPGGIFVLFELNPYNPLTQLTFRRCHIDKHATLLSPRYAKALLPTHKTLYYCFFPACLKKLRRFESHLTWLPLGALYAAVVKP